MSLKLIFMKIQDGRQDGRHMNPMGHDLILGTPTFSRQYNDYKNVG